MKPTRYIFGTFAALSAVLCAQYGYAAAGFMSKYGEIQSVQNYSSNPFWNSDSPYNSRMPTPIYATGADLNTAECNNIVDSLITTYCALNNECLNLRLADVRPKIMVQLSQLPGHNYATACGGYIDSVFNNYQKKHGNTSTNIITKPATQSVKSTLDIQIQNPYAIKPTEYQQAVAERANELRELQAANAPSTELSVTDFPKTAADLSISDTMALRSAGYEPYKDNKAYKTIQIESDETFLERLRVVNPAAYCSRITNKDKDPTCNNTLTENQTTQLNNQTNLGNNETGSTGNKTQTISGTDQELIQTIVEILNPQNSTEEEFFNALATAYVIADKQDPDVLLDKDFVYDFLGDGDTLNKYRNGLITLTGTIENEDYGVFLDWDDILTDISIVLDETLKKRSMKVCENNRSIQVGLNVVLDLATLAATISTFGTGGMLISAGRAATGAGLKALAKGTAKIGLKKATKKLGATANKQLIKAGIRKGVKKGMKVPGAKAFLKTSVKRATKQIGANLSKKRVLLLDAGVVAAQLGKGAAKRTAGGLMYSLVSSDVSKEILNCQDLDHNEGCYTVCGNGTGTDDLNTKVFQPILGKKYCVNPEDYAMYEIQPNGQMGNIMIFDDGVYPQIRQALNDIKDKGKCDWNEDDIDAYIGAFIYDPDTLEISTEELYIDDMVRLDD